LVNAQRLNLNTALRNLQTIIRLTIVSALLFACSENQGNNASDVKENSNLSSAVSTLTVSIGPTQIPNGDAQGSGDITVSNAYYSVAFAVDSASPWGVAKGGILDVAVNTGNGLGSDFVSLVDFMPNYWSAWPSSFQSTKVIEQTESSVTIRTERDWGDVGLKTDFVFSSDSNLIKIHTTMSNPNAQAIADLTTGYIGWPTGGHLFGMPGITEGDSRPISEKPAFAKWSASYDKNWSLGLHSNFSDHVAYTGRDRYLKHTLEPNESKQFIAWLQIEPSADLAKLVAVDSQINQRSTGTIKGKVLSQDSQALNDSVVVIKKDGALHSWSLAQNGSFDFSLPIGEYEVFATAQNHAPGRLQSISVSAEMPLELTLDQVQAPGKIEFSVSDEQSSNSIDAMISLVEGTKPILGYFGKSRYFTELDAKGRVALEIAPGDYQFEVSSSGGFFSVPRLVKAKVASNSSTQLEVPIQSVERPSKRNWYNADLHHHSDVLDGFTNPEYVFRSQLAAGVSLPFLSDHDSTQNNVAMRELASTRDTEFIAGTELSASWGHFNAYPIDYDLEPDPDIGLASIQDIYQEARRLGAEIIHVNHPFGNYGYFDSLNQEAEQKLEANSIVPGGYDLGFDLIEITTEHEPKTLERAWQLWNTGKPAYFSAGSDVHDVWNTLPEHSSGAARSFVYIAEGEGGNPSVDSFVAALKAGHSYASQGPLIYPEHVFGNEIQIPALQVLSLAYEVQSVVGLQTVQLIERGRVIDELHFENSKFDSTAKNIEFKVSPEANTWYSLVVSDIAGNYAYTNPLWVKTGSKQ
jgi:hypothetical protein